MTVVPTFAKPAKVGSRAVVAQKTVESLDQLPSDLFRRKRERMGTIRRNRVSKKQHPDKIGRPLAHFGPDTLTMSWTPIVINAPAHPNRKRPPIRASTTTLLQKK